MTSPSASSNEPSRLPTPNPRFTTTSTTITENLLKPQSGGLVQLSDFRKRRAEALEQQDREAQQGGSLGRFHAASSATGGDGVSATSLSKKKKKQLRKPVTKSKLSFEPDEDDENENGDEDVDHGNKTAAVNDDASVQSSLPATTATSPPTTASPPPHSVGKSKRLGPNATVSVTPKAMTKSALLREAQTRDQLRKEFLLMQEAVKATEILIPFVFYDGTNIPGGVCKVKKGDYVWVMLDRSRKVGAQLGAGGNEKVHSRREWARVGVDDLMLVRGEIIIPHHYELYYFIVNKTLGPTNIPLFDYSSTLNPPPPPLSSRGDGDQQQQQQPQQQPPPLEGSTADPNFTKVVDRRWYERNKHIFPASVWEEFDPGRDYGKGKRSDKEGNAFFFS